MTPTEQQNQALAAFVACVVERLNPSLTAHTKPHNGEAEYEVVVGGTGVGVLHEQIETVLRIAAEHGGRAFIRCVDRVWNTDDAVTVQRPLCIVWPGRQPDGPDPAAEHDKQAAQGRRKPRPGTA